MVELEIVFFSFVATGHMIFAATGNLKYIISVCSSLINRNQYQVDHFYMTLFTELMQKCMLGNNEWLKS